MLPRHPYQSSSNGKQPRLVKLANITSQQGTSTSAATENQTGHDTQPHRDMPVAASFNANLSPLAPRQLHYGEGPARQDEANSAHQSSPLLIATGPETQPSSQQPWQMPHAPPALLPNASKRSRSRTPASYREDSESETAEDPVLEVDFF